MTRRTRATRLLAAAAAVLALASAAPPASAQDAPPAGDVTKDATTMLYNAGIDAAKAGQWEKAYESFLAAFKIKQHPQIAVNLGRAAVKTGRPREAAEYLTFFLRETKEQVGNQDRAAIQQLLLEAKAKIGTLIVKVNKPGADVVVDGKVVGQAPLRDDVFVEPGKHTVEARLGKEQAEAVTVELGAGDSRQVGLAVGAKGAVQGSTTDGAPEPAGTSAGADGADDGRTRRTVIQVGIGVTALAAVAGGVFTTLAFVKLGERNDKCNPFCAAEDYEQQAQWQDAENAKKSFRTAAIGSFAAAAVLGAGTIVYASLSGKKSGAPVQTGMLIAPGFGGVTVRGAW